MALLAVLLVPAIAEANTRTGVGLDFGYMHGRVAVGDDTTMSGGVGRFAISIGFQRYFHAGVEAEEGWLTGTTPLRSGAVARTTSPTGSPLEGNTLALKTFGGLHTNAGALRISADVAYGFRDTWVSSHLGNDIGGRKNAPLLELRTRLDLWMTKTTTVGVTTSSDVLERRDVSVGLVFALRFST